MSTRVEFQTLVPGQHIHQYSYWPQRRGQPCKAVESRTRLLSPPAPSSLTGFSQSLTSASSLSQTRERGDAGRSWEKADQSHASRRCGLCPAPRPRPQKWLPDVGKLPPVPAHKVEWCKLDNNVIDSPFHPDCLLWTPSSCLSEPRPEAPRRCRRRSSHCHNPYVPLHLCQLPAIKNNFDVKVWRSHLNSVTESNRGQELGYSFLFVHLSPCLSILSSVSCSFLFGKLIW